MIMSDFSKDIEIILRILLATIIVLWKSDIKTAV